MTEQERLRARLVKLGWGRQKAFKLNLDDLTAVVCRVVEDEKMAAPTGSTPQRPVHNALTLLMEALNDPHYQQESTEMAREAMQMAKDEIERLNAIVAAEARASVLGADLPVIEMRLCEIPHLMLRPNQLYRFTVDHDCKGCASTPVERPADELSALGGQMGDNTPQFDIAYKWLSEKIDARFWDINTALNLSTLLQREQAQAVAEARLAGIELVILHRPIYDHQSGDLVACTECDWRFNKGLQTEDIDQWESHLRQLADLQAQGGSSMKHCEIHRTILNDEENCYWCTHSDKLEKGELYGKEKVKQKGK